MELIMGVNNWKMLEIITWKTFKVSKKIKSYNAFLRNEKQLYIGITAPTPPPKIG